MNILIDIGHPAHVHLLRNTYFELQKHGHKIIVTVKDIPIAQQLLHNYGIPYITLGVKKDSLFQKALSQISFDWQILRLVRKHKIDLGIGTSVSVAHVSRITKMKSIILDDDDDAVQMFFVKLAHPFADVILSPNAVQTYAPRKAKQTIYYAGYHELAYLHPKRFMPDPSVLQELGIAADEQYFILRFNAFKAHHDVGVEGLSIDNKRRLIQMLSQHGRVFITTERNIDEEFRQYQLSVPPEKIHSLMYYATMLVGDSQTMTSEAAVLGTPAIRSNTFVGRISYIEEEEHRYGLTYGFLPSQSEAMFDKIEELLAMPDVKKEWQQRRARMLAEKIDVTAFFTWFVENYPDSHNVMKYTPDYQLNFM